MMIKKHLPFAMILLAALPAFAAPDGEPANPRPARSTNNGVMRYDTNRDGVVDRVEWTAGQEARFKQLDTDKDGFITQADVASNAELSGSFADWDDDKDTKLSQAEFDAFVASTVTDDDDDDTEEAE